MKLPCEMMEDLLPLYAEDMATNATRQAVEEHLKDCEPCKEKLEAMRRDKPESAAPIPLEPVRREIRVRRWHAVVAAVCAVAVGLVALLCGQSTLAYMPYSACEITVEALPDGGVEIHYMGPNGMHEWMQDDILYAAPIGHRAGERNGETITPVRNERAVYFVDVTRQGETTLIWAKTPEDEVGAAQILPRLALGYYMLIAMATGIALLALWYPLRRRRMSWIPKRLGVLALCYVVAHLTVMGTNSMSFDMVRDFGYIAVIALLLWGLATSGEELIKQMRRDRA